MGAKIEMEIERDRYAAATKDDSQFAIWRWLQALSKLCELNLPSEGTYDDLQAPVRLNRAMAVRPATATRF